MLIGLPGQNKEDLDDMVAFIDKSKSLFRGTIYASINTIVPKLRTEYAGLPFQKSLAREQAAYLKKNAKTKLKISNINTSFIEWKLANAKNIVLKQELKEVPLHSMAV